MNLSKKHIKHIKYVKSKDEPNFYNFVRGKKIRKRLRDFRKDMHRSDWMKNLWKLRGIRI